MGIKLNLGCGTKHKKGYINIDVQDPCDLRHDLRNPLLFEDNSVDEIWSEGNTISLFTPDEWRGLKREIARVLKPEGKLEIIFLDLEYIFRAFLDNKDGERWGWWRQTIYSAQENEYDFSKNGFTYDKLVSDLQAEGMANFSEERLPEDGYVRLTCYKYKLDADKIMKILIGTPVNECKDYCMERWLQNVAELQKEYPADLLLVDNSPGLDYMEKVRGYCEKYGVKNYKLEHLEIWHLQSTGEKISRSREIIRQEILASDYDAWFTWESDQIIPPDALNKLATVMKAGNYTMISHNAWKRGAENVPETGFGCCLVKRECLEKYGFLLEYPNMPVCWHAGEVWFKKQVLAGGGNYIEVYGMIDPIYHLDG